MNIDQYLSIVRYAAQECCDLPVTHNVNTQTVTVHFRGGDLSILSSSDDRIFEYTYTCTEIADYLDNDSGVAYLVDRAQYFVESELCERCETYEQDRDVVAVGDEYCCADCFDNMIAQHDRSTTEYSMRGRI